METHAHELHRTPGHGWKHYLFEFFMLFLAVFCGFLAENLREGQLERQREKEYMKSLFEDVIKDTQNIRSTINAQRTHVKGKDSLIQLINKGINSPQDHLAFYNLHWKYVGYVFTVAFSKRTLTQLLNSGGLRLIKNKKVSDAIAVYASKVNELEMVEQPDNSHQSNETLMESKKFIDTRYMRAIPADTMASLPFISPVVRNNSPDALKDFSFVLELDKENTIVRIGLLKRQLIDAENLLQLLRSEYQIKTE